MDFSHHVDDSVLPAIDAARLAHNATLPPGPGLPPGSPPPGAILTKEEFLRHHLDAMVRGWVIQFPIVPLVSTDPSWYIVTRKQGLKALARANSLGLPAPIYEADISARIEAMPETTPAEILAKNDMRIEFRDAQTWRRGNPFFEQMVAAMGITPTQRDALLQLATTFLE